MATSVVHGIVVRVSDYGEAHQVVDLLTKEEGLKRAFASSSRKSRRRFAGALEPGNRLAVVLRTSPRRELANLEEASVEAGLRGAARSNLSAMLRVGWMLDLSRSLVGDEQIHEGLYELLSSAVDMLDEGRLPPWGLVAFELSALASFGVAPRFDACCRCERAPSSESSRFSPLAGGLLCPACSPGWGPGDLPLTRLTLKVLQAMSDADLGAEVLVRCAAFPDSPIHVAEARLALSRCTENLLGRPLKSRELLDRLDLESHRNDPQRGGL